MWIKIKKIGQVHPWLDTIQKASSWILMLNSWVASSNKIWNWSIVLWILIFGLTFLCVVCMEFNFHSLDFHSRRGLRHTLGANSWHPVTRTQVLKLNFGWCRIQIFVFIHHSLSPFGTNVFFSQWSVENWALHPKYMIQILLSGHGIMEYVLVA
jgi:hypothetical protein